MIYSNRTVLKTSIAIVFSAALMTAPIAMAHEHEKENLAAAADKTVTGEIVDVMCYVDHGAMGDKHAACSSKCIEGGGPVGIVSDGKLYIVVGDHKPMNGELAEYAGKTITLKGKMASNGGITMLENAEIVKK